MYKKSLLLVAFLVAFLGWVWPALGRVDEAAVKARVRSVSLPFIENTGQVDSRVAYYVRTFGGTVFVTKDGKLVYNLPAEKGGVALREVFVGAEVKEVSGEERAQARVSYFRGKDRRRWVSGLSTYHYVSLGEVWKGIRLKVRAYGDNVEKLFYVAPGARVESIKVKLEGAKELEVAEDGRLKVVTEKGDVYFTKPVAYQEEGGKRKYVEVAYKVEGSEYGFEVKGYDPKKALVIDPLLASTYLGGESFDEGADITLDSFNNVYIVGRTASSNFPVTMGAYDTDYNAGYSDVIITKFDSSLNQLISSTFLGGSYDEHAEAILVDKNGNVWVVGGTMSDNFPTTSGSYDPVFNGASDIFICKFNSDLSQLLASTFLGGADTDDGYDVAIASEGNGYITGNTHSGDFPTTSVVYIASYHQY